MKGAFRPNGFVGRGSFVELVAATDKRRLRSVVGFRGRL